MRQKQIKRAGETQEAIGASNNPFEKIGRACMTQNKSSASSNASKKSSGDIQMGEKNSFPEKKLKELDRKVKTAALKIREVELALEIREIQLALEIQKVSEPLKKEIDSLRAEWGSWPKLHIAPKRTPKRFKKR